MTPEGAAGDPPPRTALVTGGTGGMGRVIASKLAADGFDFTVNAVAPGPTATAAFLDSTPPGEQQQLAALPPLGRLGRPGDIAGVVSFLAGPAGRWVNGQVVYANGGAV